MAEPVDLPDIRAHLRLGSSTAQDGYLESLVLAARRAVELRTRRSMTGDDPTLTDDDLEQAKQAIRLIVGTWFSYREGATADARSIPTEMPLAVTWLVDPLIRWDDGSDA